MRMANFAIRLPYPNILTSGCTRESLGSAAGLVMPGKRNTARQNRREQVWAKVKKKKKKISGPPIKSGRLKNLYTKSERLTLNCRVIGLGLKGLICAVDK